jgi:hypothetical protein
MSHQYPSPIEIAYRYMLQFEMSRSPHLRTHPPPPHIESHGSARRLLNRTQASLTNLMDSRRQYLKLLGRQITDDTTVSNSSPKALA